MTKKLLVFLAVLLTVCFSGSTVMAQNVIKIGQINPLTGPAAGWGLPVDRGINLFADMINEGGGISIKGKKYTFKIYSENDKFNVEAGRAATEKLINAEKVQFIIGSFVDSTVQSMVPLATEKKIITLLGSTGGVKSGMGPEYPYSFRYTHDAMGKLAVLNVALKTLKFKRMAIFNTDTPLGRGNAEAAAQWAKQNNIEVTDNVLAPSNATDFYPSLKTVLEKKPEMIHGAVPPGQMALVCKQAYELGYRGYYSNVGAMVNVAEFIKIAGQDAVQNFIAPYEDSSSPVVTKESKVLMEKLKDRYLKKYGPPFEPLAWRYATGLQILVQAIEEAQTLDPDVLVKTLENTEFKTMLGNGTFAGKKTYGIAHQFSVNTLTGIIKGDHVVHLGYVHVETP